MPIAGEIHTRTETVSDTVTTLNTSLGTVRPQGAEVTVDDESIRWTCDTAVNIEEEAHIALEGTAISLFTRGMVENFRCTRATSNNATITYSTGSDAYP